MTKLSEENRAKRTVAARKAFEYVKGKIRKALNYVKGNKADYPWWFALLFGVVVFLAVAAVVLIDLLFTARALNVK